MSQLFVPQMTVAALLACSDRKVRSMVREGLFTTNPGGAIPAEQVREAIRSQALDGLVVGEDGKTYDYEAERARKTHMEAELASLDLAKQRSELVPIEVVSAQMADVFGALGNIMNAWPARVAPQVAGRDLIETERALKQAVKEGRQHLSDFLRKYADSASLDSGSTGDRAAAGSDDTAVGGPEPVPEQRRQRRARQIQQRSSSVPKGDSGNPE